MARVGKRRITVTGTGYLGATHAACMAELGFEVLGMDVDAEKIGVLASGRSPFFEPGLNEVLARNVASGRLRFTTDPAELAAFGGEGAVHFLCVNTPQSAGSDAADLRYLNLAVEALAPHLTESCVVVGKSTVPVGTAAAVADRLRELAPAAVETAWNPEFLREGHAVADTLHPDRLVVGVESAEAEQALRDVYASLLEDGVPFLTMDLATSELVKTAANSFLATKISFINAMAEVCEAADADVVLLAQALRLDPRIGTRFLEPGLGFGGACLPKDIRGFAARSRELGVGQALAFLHEVDGINLRRRARAVTLARELCGGSLEGRRVAVWGAAFKPDSDDVRDSPSLAVADALAGEGALVTVYDPEARDNAAKYLPHLGFADSAREAARDAQVVVHATEWPEFREIDPVEAAGWVAQPHLVDCRNTLDLAAWRGAGWTVAALGRPAAAR
ncbi:UDP-glucose/GDP-mannose dehydrogenase family protein [Actinospica durhamensis]|uniref:UDP-glucose 6-dehydrogenase n=1 Tax=Actinospica durhamensis TaxID=1508375 RepID=A0A941EML5_9ACTN|nr:UDP-glucose/GDP-mannose dehydrogenase family protein [Actinospica durhamensis]MBR7833163.1 UDP-glucose/GDP-mannose dehydrogenase family protein [Actinospica durhamensis]